jgi:hypothetical protein
MSILLALDLKKFIYVTWQYAEAHRRCARLVGPHKPSIREAEAEDLEFETSPGYTVKPCLKKTKNKPNQR